MICTEIRGDKRPCIEHVRPKSPLLYPALQIALCCFQDYDKQDFYLSKIIPSKWRQSLTFKAGKDKAIYYGHISQFTNMTKHVPILFLIQRIAKKEEFFASLSWVENARSLRFVQHFGMASIVWNVFECVRVHLWSHFGVQPFLLRKRNPVIIVSTCWLYFRAEEPLVSFD